MTFYIRHDGRNYKIESIIGFDLDSGLDNRHLTRFSIDEIHQAPGWETDLEPQDEDLEP